MTISSESLSLVKALKQGSFTIPRHQRSYDWEEEHVQDLLDDLKLCLIREDDNNEHLLGAIMLIGDPLSAGSSNNEWVINDGQQRIMTCSLLCAQLCRHFRDVGDSHGENSMLKVLFQIDEETTASMEDVNRLPVRVNVSQREKTTYETFIRGENISRNGKILRAWETIERFLNEQEHQSDDWRKRLMSFILQKLKIIAVYVSPDADVNAVFETLNGRGKKLEQIHLLRNYIYSHFVVDDPLSDTVQRELDKIADALPEGSMEEYAHCSAQTKYGYIAPQRFYRDFRVCIDKHSGAEKEEIYSFVADLGKDHRPAIFRMLSSGYRAADSALEIINELTVSARQGNRARKIEDYIKDMREYSVVHPVMFALLCRYAESRPSERAKVAKFVYRSSQYLSSFTQRVSHVNSNFNPSRYAKRLAALANKVSKGECRTPENFLKILKAMDDDGIINDSTYIEKMKQGLFKSNAKKAKYLLARIFEKSGQDVNEGKCSVEHILPQSPQHLSGWGGFDRATHALYVYQLGNLTLLKQGEDKPDKQSNANFAAKKAIYAKSGYVLTQEIAEQSDWDPAAINKRQKKLARLAADIWNFPR